MMTISSDPAAAPGLPTDRDADRSAKREAVLKAAVAMFNERGFHATSLNDVAASLQISKPMIYYYLGNKDSVLLECMRIGLDQLQEAATLARAMPGRGVEKLRAFLRRYAEVNMDDFGRCVIRTGDEVLSPSGRTEFRSLKRLIDDTLRALLHDAIADGSIKTVDIRLAAFSIAGALNWPARWHRPDGELPAAHIAEQMVDLLIGGLLPPVSGTAADAPRTSDRDR